MEPMHFARIQNCADLLAFEPLLIYIAITTPFKMGLREEVGVWQKNARRVDRDSTTVPLLYSVGQADFYSRRQATGTTGKRGFGLRR
jgi:hypothetical protein